MRLTTEKWLRSFVYRAMDPNCSMVHTALSRLWLVTALCLPSLALFVLRDLQEEPFARPRIKMLTSAISSVWGQLYPYYLPAIFATIHSFILPHFVGFRCYENEFLRYISEGLKKSPGLPILPSRLNIFLFNIFYCRLRSVDDFFSAREIIEMKWLIADKSIKVYILDEGVFFLAHPTYWFKP